MKRNISQFPFSYHVFICRAQLQWRHSRRDVVIFSPSLQ
uniref:Uncharacterized protein n=1 Tax=Anguilla anguilla TaxID=7936 RepID=A0A0E9UQ51_ANGAN